MRLHQLQLNENLGNLASLNAGNLINLLKQDRWGHQKLGNKFASAHQLGNTSEIIDAGIVKTGLKDIRAAYRKYDEYDPIAFVLLLNNKAVMLGMYSSYDLAGQKRDGMFAYDLTEFDDILQKKHDALKSAEEEKANRWERQRVPPKTDPTSAHTKEIGWGDDRQQIHLIGKSYQINEIQVIIDETANIAKEINGTMTLMLATRDKAGTKRRMQRQTWRDSRSDLLTLNDRLKKYKNTKKPTANSIEEFVKFVFEQKIPVVQFAGKAYKTKPDQSYKTVDANYIMTGQPFKMSYYSAEPDSRYDTIKISYRFNPATQQIQPWRIEYPENGKTVIVPMDPAYYVSQTLRVRDTNNKDEVIRKMLTTIKESPHSPTFNNIKSSIDALRGMGNDWPELKIIEQTIAAELAKK